LFTRAVCAVATAAQLAVSGKEEIMAIKGPEQSVGKPTARCRKTRSSLVRRLVQAGDDPAKQRIRRWLSDIDDKRLLSFGLTPQDIALLRGSPSAGNFVALILSVRSPSGSWF
jgi:hypothetical protein